MELLILVNACKSASATRITAILPYFPYGKHSKKKQARGCVSAKCESPPLVSVVDQPNPLPLTLLVLTRLLVLLLLP